MSRRASGKKKKKAVPTRPIDRKLQEYSSYHTTDLSVGFQCIAIPLLTFGCLGLIWAIPFPHLDFLGSFNGYFNWASILIASVIYYYYRLSPVLSYLMILTVGIYSYFIVQLEYWEAAQGPDFWLSALVTALLGALIYGLGRVKEAQTLPIKRTFWYLLIGPLWLWSLLLRKVRIPY